MPSPSKDAYLLNMKALWKNTSHNGLMVCILKLGACMHSMIKCVPTVHKPQQQQIIHDYIGIYANDPKIYLQDI